jgi:inosose dehydratase
MSNNQEKTMPSRRHFLQSVGLGAAATLAVRHGFAEEAAAPAEPSAKQAAKRAYELGIASYTVRLFPLEKGLEMSKRLGLMHFCMHPKILPLDSTPEQIAEAAAKVKKAGLDLYAGGVIYMHKPAEVDRAFEYAKTAGMKMIVGVPVPDVLPLVNEKVQKYDIRMAIHNHGPTDKVYPTPDVAYAKIKDLDHRIGLCIDIGHTQRAGQDPSEAAAKFADRLLDIHIKDVTSATAQGKTCEAGHGVIDLPKFLRTLDQIHYKGVVSFEFEKDSNDPMPGLAEAVGYIRGVQVMI